MKRARPYIGLVLFTAIFVTIITTVGVYDITAALKEANLFFIALAFLSMFFYHIFLAINYTIYFKLPFTQSLLTILSGEFFNVISPGINIGGEPFKGYIMTKLQNQPFSKQFSAVLSVKMMDALWYIFFGAVSIIFGILFIDLPANATLITQIVAFTALFIALILLLRRSATMKDGIDAITRGILETFRFLFRFTIMPAFFYLDKRVDLSLWSTVGQKVGKKITNIKVATKEFMHNTRKSLRNVFLNQRIFFPLFIFNLIGWLFLFLKTFFVFLAFNHPIHFITAILAWMLPSFLGSIIFVPGGIGVTETIMVGLFVSLGVPLEIAAAIAIVDRFIFYAWGLGGGYLSFTILKFWKNV